MKAVYSVLIASVATGFAVFGMMEYPRADDGSGRQNERSEKVPAGDSAPLSEVKSEKSIALTDVSKIYVQIARDVKPSVVVIETGGEGSGRSLRSPAPSRGMGSGFITDVEKGYVLTNAHVVGESRRVTVTTYDKRRYDGLVVGAEPSMDVAVVRIMGLKPEGLRSVKWGDSDRVDVGEMVLALGAPFGLSQTLTHGIISAVGRGDVGGGAILEEMLQTDAPINPGNSGGPLLNLRGEVIGINTAISSPSGASAGVSFAVPARVAKIASEMLIHDGRVTRGYLGLQGDDVDDALSHLKLPADVRGGALVTAVEPAGPAKGAGLQPYDVVTEIDGRPVTNFAQLRSAVAFLKPGHRVNLVFYRDGQKKNASVAIGRFPDAVAAR